MADDPPGDKPGNLNHAIALALVRNHENRVSFVVFGSLVEAGVHKLARVVHDFINLALMGNAVALGLLIGFTR